MRHGESEDSERGGCRRDAFYLASMDSRKLWLVAWAMAGAWVATGQTDRGVDDTCIRAPHISLNLGGAVPQGAWGESFGAFGNVGGLVGLKGANNHYVALRAVSWWGADVTIPGLLGNLTTDNDEIIDDEGDVARIRITGQGAQFGACFGHVFSTMRSNPNSGWLVRAGLGSIHHRVDFEYTENAIGPLEGDRSKGYDRLRWGACVDGFVGYWHMSNDQRINLFVGVVGGMANTWAIRSVNFDTLTPNEPQTLDTWWGVELGWVFQLYKREAKEYWH